MIENMEVIVLHDQEGTSHKRLSFANQEMSKVH